MLWQGKISGAAIGLLFGPAGALAGALSGHFLQDKQKTKKIAPAQMSTEKRKKILIDSTFALLGKIAAADYEISPKENDILHEIILDLGITGKTRQRAEQVFKQEQNLQSFGESAVALEFAWRHDRPTLIRVLNYCLMMGLAHDRLSWLQDEWLRWIQDCFAIKHEGYLALRERFLDPQAELFHLLRCPPGATRDQLAAARRSISRELHPDLIQDEQKKLLAQEKISAVNAAFEKLKRS